MKRILLSLILLSLVSVPIIASAQVTPPTTDLMDMLRNIRNWLIALLLIVASIFIVVAAFYFVTAAGNPETIAKARTFVLYALIGVLVALLSYALVAFVMRIVGMSTTTV